MDYCGCFCSQNSGNYQTILVFSGKEIKILCFGRFQQFFYFYLNLRATFFSYLSEAYSALRGEKLNISILTQVLRILLLFLLEFPTILHCISRINNFLSSLPCSTAKKMKFKLPHKGKGSLFQKRSWCKTCK